MEGAVPKTASQLDGDEDADGQADRALVDTVTVFDVYEGKGVPEGQKSVAVAVRIQPASATQTLRTSSW